MFKLVSAVKVRSLMLVGRENVANRRQHGGPFLACGGATRGANDKACRTPYVVGPSTILSGRDRLPGRRNAHLERCPARFWVGDASSWRCFALIVRLPPNPSDLTFIHSLAPGVTASPPSRRLGRRNSDLKRPWRPPETCACRERLQLKRTRPGDQWKSKRKRNKARTEPPTPQGHTDPERARRVRRAEPDSSRGKQRVHCARPTPHGPIEGQAVSEGA